MNRQQRRMAVKQKAKSTNGLMLSMSEFDIAAHEFQRGRIVEAEAACRAILASRTGDSFSLHRLGKIAHHFRRYGVAVDLLRAAIAGDRKNIEAYCSLAIVFKDRGNLDDAIQTCRDAIILRPDFSEAHNALGRVFHQKGSFVEAEQAYRRAISLDPKHAAGHFNLGILLQDLGDLKNAQAAFQEAIRVKPEFVDAHRWNAQALRQLERLDEAAVSLRVASSLNPKEAGYYSDLAIIYMRQGRFLDAIDFCKKALALNPDDAGTLSNLGNCLHELGRSDEAISAYSLAIRTNPRNPTFCSNLATVYGTTNRANEAIAAFRGALAISPDCVKSLTGLCQQRRAICDWVGLESDEISVITKLRQDAEFERVPPFALLSMPEISPADLLRGASLWAAPFRVPDERVLVHSRAGRTARGEQRIRIGYLSADFFNHATALLIAELIEKHDRKRFEILGYSYGPDDKSPMRRRLVDAFDQFVEFKGVPHAEAAQRIYDDSIDILVDLKGYTRDARTEILAYRPAPIQVNYLGYPGTMGAGFVDYIIGDPIVTPLSHQPYFSEKIVQLPHSYQPNDTQRVISEAVPTRAECKLPEGAFVFCCFNNTYKLTQTFFAVWMRLLKSVPDSVLWLLEANTSVRENLSREAASYGIDPKRLIFAQRMPVPEHLARHCHADLFLDTLPVNAHTTTSDALWAGLPVVTCVGPTFAGRVAASLLRAADLPELVTSSLEEYEALALRLATTPSLLADIREKLLRNRLAVPLFDIENYTRDLEAAYVHMIEHMESGALPEAFAVADLLQPAV